MPLLIIVLLVLDVGRTPVSFTPATRGRVPIGDVSERRQPAKSATTSTKDADLIRSAQKDEVEFRDRESPDAIRSVAKELQLSEETTNQLLILDGVFRASARTIWARLPVNDSDARRKAKAVAKLRRDLDRDEKILLSAKCYYDFSKRFAREMNRRRWLREGLALPPPENDITSD
jgi:hypothetical protein